MIPWNIQLFYNHNFFPHLMGALVYILHMLNVITLVLCCLYWFNWTTKAGFFGLFFQQLLNLCKTIHSEKNTLVQIFARTDIWYSWERIGHIFSARRSDIFGCPKKLLYKLPFLHLKALVSMHDTSIQSFHTRLVGKFMSFLYKTKIVSSVSWQASRGDVDAVFVFIFPSVREMATFCYWDSKETLQ